MRAAVFNLFRPVSLWLALLGLACPFSAVPASAGPIRVGVEPVGEVHGPVLVRVIGHYASIHNGISRHWRDALIPVGERRFIALGPVNLLLNMGVSVRIVHPEFLSDSARSYSTPLLVRPVSFDTFEPRIWREVMQSGELRFGARPDTPSGHVLYQAAGHLQSFLLEYLPALDIELDAGPELEASEAALPGQLTLLEEIARYALAAEPPLATRTLSVSEDKRKSYARSLANQDVERRVEIEEYLHRIREWLSIPRGERRQLRLLMEQMRYTKDVANALMTDADRRRIGSFLGDVADSRAKREDYDTTTSWIDPTSHVGYRVSIGRNSGLSGPSGRCARLSVMVDLTRVVEADLAGLTHAVNGYFCRSEDGSSRYERS